MERTVPNPPELVAPVQGAPVRGGSAKLVWKPVEGAVGYHAQVAADKGFTRRVVDTRLGDVASLVVHRVLHGREGQVFWRVAAIGPGGTGAFSEAADFISSPAPAEEPHAGLTAEAGAETAARGAREHPTPVQRHDTGWAGFGVLVIAILLSVIAAGIAFIAFPGLSSEPAVQATGQQTIPDSLRLQQQQQAEALTRYQADSTGYTIPIDSAIARMANQSEAAPESGSN